MFQLFKPAPHIERLDDSKTDAAYKRLRLQVFLGGFSSDMPGIICFAKTLPSPFLIIRNKDFQKENLAWCGRINRLRLQQIYYGDGV